MHLTGFTKYLQESFNKPIKYLGNIRSHSFSFNLQTFHKSPYNFLNPKVLPPPPRLDGTISFLY